MPIPRTLEYWGMAITRMQWRWTALAGLWTLVGFIGFLLVVQAFLTLLMAYGTWQRPGIAPVKVISINHDLENNFTDKVLVTRGRTNPRLGILRMLKSEVAQLRVGDEFWVLDNYFHNELRPAQFRLSPQRLLLEYPEPLLLLALLAIWRVRRIKPPPEDPNRVRTLLRDDFHLRAQRFARGGQGES
jgi:hypothetical protein